jgi:hypothetical protein
MKVHISLTKGFAYVWLSAVMFLILVGMVGTWMKGGFSAVLELLSPFNIANYLVTVIALAPGLGALYWVERLNKRIEGNTQVSDSVYKQGIVGVASSDLKSKHFDEPITLDEAQSIVNRYGTVLENTKTQFHDEAVLPAPKQRIKDSLVILARDVKKAGGSIETISHLRFGYASLAYYVSTRDAKLASVYDDITASAGRLDDNELLEIAAKLAVPGGGALDVSRDAFKEFERLIVEFDKRIQR